MAVNEKEKELRKVRLPAVDTQDQLRQSDFVELHTSAAARGAKSHTFASDCKALGETIYTNPLNLLLLTLPPAVAGYQWQWNQVTVFVLNFLAILPLAGMLGNATEELSRTVGETIGGLLNATFGNAVEMILSVLALRRGLVDVVQGSLLGSILSNLLLVLGMCFFFGGLKFKTQRYNAEGSRVQSSLLLLSTLAMAIPTMSFLNVDNDQEMIEIDGLEMPVAALAVSRGCAATLGTIYCLYLYFQLVTHRDCFEGVEDEDPEDLVMSPGFSVCVLLIATMLVAVCSEGIVDSVEAMTERMGISRSFIGVILLPIVGNAAEHLTAVSVALKDKLDLSLGVALGSSTQIALFVVPFTVLAGWAMGTPMNLNFRPMSTAILLLTVLIVGNLTGDGESNWLEGAMLLAAYLIICITFWYVD